MNQSLSISLTPLTVGQMLDRAFRIYRAHFGKFVGIAAILQVASFLVQAGVTTFSTLSFGTTFEAALEQDPELLFSGQFLILAMLGTVSTLVVLALGLLTQAALAKGIISALSGEKFTIQSAYKDVLPYTGKLIAQFFVLLGLWIVVFVWFIIPCIGWFTGLGMIFFLAVITAFSVPILILENRGAAASISRAWYLLRRRFWPVVGYVFAVGLLTGIITGALTSLVSFGSQAIIASNPSTGVLLGFQLGQLALTAIVSAIILPLTFITYLLLYFDLRVRTEGFDLTMKANMASGLSTAEIIKITPPKEDEKLIRGDDMLQFFLLTLLGIVIYAILIAIVLGIVALIGTQTSDVFQSIPFE